MVAKERQIAETKTPPTFAGDTISGADGWPQPTHPSFEHYTECSMCGKSLVGPDWFCHRCAAKLRIVGRHFRDWPKRVKQLVNYEQNRRRALDRRRIETKFRVEPVFEIQWLMRRNPFPSPISWEQEPLDRYAAILNERKVNHQRAVTLSGVNYTGRVTKPPAVVLPESIWSAWARLHFGYGKTPDVEASNIRYPESTNAVYRKANKIRLDRVWQHPALVSYEALDYRIEAELIEAETGITPTKRTEDGQVVGAIRPAELRSDVPDKLYHPARLYEPALPPLCLTRLEVHLMLAKAMGYSNREVAESLHMSKSAIGRRWADIRKKQRENPTEFADVGQWTRQSLRLAGLKTWRIPKLSSDNAYLAGIRAKATRPFDLYPECVADLPPYRDNGPPAKIWLLSSSDLSNWPGGGLRLRCVRCGMTFGDSPKIWPTWPAPPAHWRTPTCPRCSSGWLDTVA